MAKIDFSKDATVARAGQAFRDRDDRQHDHWEETFQYIFPYRDLSEAANNTPRHKVIYDNTPVDAASRLVNKILTGLVPPWLPWFRLSPGIDMELTVIESQDPDGDMSDLQRSLDRVSSVLHAHMNASNFHRVMQEVISDMVVACGVIAIEPDIDNQSIKFVDVPLDQVALIQDEFGDIRFVYHQMQLLNLTAVQQYGSVISEQNPSLYKTMMDRPDQTVNILVAVEYNSENGMYLKRRLLWSKGDDQYSQGTPQSAINILIEEEELDYSPYHVARWSATPNNPYGEGPGLKAMADMRTLNNVMQNFLQNLKLQAAGIWTALDDDVINPYTLEIQAGTVMTVGSNDNQNPSIRRLDVPTNVQAVGLGIEDLRENIKRQMFSDQFTPGGRTPRTATEIMEHADEIAREMGASFGILTSEFLIPMIRTAMKLLSRYEKYEALFEDVDVDGLAFTIEFLGSISRAQKRREGNEQLSVVSTLGQLGQLYPEAPLLIDHKSILRDTLDKLGVADEHIRNESELQAEVEKAQQGMQQVQEQLGQGQPGEGQGPVPGQAQ
jgi:hypothetical protein